ncbi:hypothetical protein [Larkinella soli]|uniref:hypothetical protein n=1 Tax=Larkinella soli TaxID=1770527 RepID=UPI000FFBD3EB|nr:hypothetical protein [Larkinella soli]
MNDSDFSEIINYIGLYSFIVPVSVIFWRFRYLRGPVLWFAVLKLFKALVTILSNILMVRNIQYPYLPFIEVAVDALFLSYIYGYLIRSEPSKTVVRWFGPVFALFTVVMYVLGLRNAADYGNYLVGAESLAITVMLIIFLRQLMEDRAIESLRRTPFFLISAGLLLDNLISVPIYFSVQPLMDYSFTLALRAYNLVLLFALISNLFYAAGFWFTKKEFQDNRGLAVG